MCNNIIRLRRETKHCAAYCCFSQNSGDIPHYTVINVEWELIYKSAESVSCNANTQFHTTFGHNYAKLWQKILSIKKFSVTLHSQKQNELAH